MILGVKVRFKQKLMVGYFLDIGGNHNMSETFDEWSEDFRGNREYLDLMKFLGLVERS